MKRIGIAIVALALGALACGGGTAALPVNTPAPAGAGTTAALPLATLAPAATTAPTPAQAGLSRDNPAPPNTTVDLGGDLSLVILGIVRPADDIVGAGNAFNTEPEAGQEYLQVELQVTCAKTSSDKCYLSSSEFKAVGVDGNVRDAEWAVAGVEGQLESGEFFGGATRQGKLFFIVPQGDPTVVLFHEPLFFGDPVYFALP